MKKVRFLTLLTVLLVWIPEQIHAQLPRIEWGTHAIATFDFDFSPEGKEIACMGPDSDIVFFLLKNGMKLRSLPLDGAPWALAYSHDGRTLAVGTTQAVRVIQVSDGSNVLNVNTSFRNFTFSPDDRYFSITTLETLPVFDLKDRKLLLEIKPEGSERLPGGTLAFLPDGKTLAVAVSSSLSPPHEASVEFWRFSDDQKLRTLANAEVIYGLSVKARLIASNGGRLQKKQIQLWRLGDGSLARTLAFDSHVSIRSAAYTPDGKVLAACTTGGIYFWRVSDGKLLGVLREKITFSTPIKFSPDGRFYTYFLNESLRVADNPFNEKRPVGLTGNSTRHNKN